MKFNRLMLVSALLCGISAGAHATRNPTPPPSGIVVHLFGPGSIMSNVVPDVGGEAAKPATVESGSVQPGGAPVTAAAPQAAGANEPTLGAVLHQMFVVGDPDHPNQPSMGRTADH